MSYKTWFHPSPPDPAWKQLVIVQLTPLEDAVNRAIAIEVNKLRHEVVRAGISSATRFYDVYQISMKAVELLAGQGGHDEFAKQFVEPGFDPWEMRRAIVEMARRWGGAVEGELLRLTGHNPHDDREGGVTQF